MATRLFLVGFSILLLLMPPAAAMAQSPPPDGRNGMQRPSTTHPGVVFVIPDRELRAWDKAFEDPFLLWNGRPRPAEIVNALAAERFPEMVSQYAAAKSTLPSCLTKALDAMLAELKKGARKVFFIWERKDVPWQQLGSRQVESGKTLSPSEIRIYNVYLRTDSCGGQKTGLTNGLLLHEFIHATKEAFPDCFQALTYKQNESSTEDAVVRVLGQSVCTPYKTAFHYPDYPATFENICATCVAGCPSE